MLESNLFRFIKVSFFPLRCKYWKMSAFIHIKRWRIKVSCIIFRWVWICNSYFFCARCSAQRSDRFKKATLSGFMMGNTNIIIEHSAFYECLPCGFCSFFFGLLKFRFMKHGKNGLVKQMFNRFNVNIRDTLYNNNQHCGKKKQSKRSI